MKPVYITSTLHNAFNLAFNPKLCAAIEEHGVACYLPQRDTNQNGTAEEKYAQNILAIDHASIILCVAKNETPNWGAEVAYAYAKGKKIIALTENGHAPPLMTIPMISKIISVEKIEDVPAYIQGVITDLKKPRSR